MSFSKIEIKDIIISLLVLSFAFSYPEVISSPMMFPVILFAVGLGFILHELAHKFVARNFGCFSEFKAYYKGLGLAVLLAIVTGGRFVFAAPGAVYFSGKLRKKEIGLVSLAGPLTNIILFLAFLMLSFIPLFGFAAKINIWLALFNLIPIDPFDGGKVFRWNKIIWATFFLASLAGFFWGI